MDIEAFADVYAQTITYGLFAARLHDPTLPTFDRDEAARLLPKSNPFLRKFFQTLRDDIDPRIEWIVDDLIEVFKACDVKKLLESYGRSTKRHDPIVHFYEDFLADYDPKLRKARGVWYTPEPVVDFIVRGVYEILKTEFGINEGLADKSKITIKTKTQGQDLRTKHNTKTKEELVHRVQVLDPATGTGTFLAQVIKQVHSHYENMPAIWSEYVKKDLIPRIHGFEIMMASYSMAHMKLDLLLRDLGHEMQGDERLGVYLTNSLEEAHPESDTLFASWLADEASEANRIKEETPVMCVIGNPPYNGESTNKGDWIMSLMDDYKKEPGGKEKLKERNPKWINDDYVKFLRYGQQFIEKNENGILAFINPHGFLDNPTFRGMRWHLLKTYDKIYTIDLHGNKKKNETTLDGNPDSNVFDIQQGVSINIFVKTGQKKANELGKIYHYDLYGGRALKYDFLNENSIQSIDFNRIPNVAPMYFMVPKDFKSQASYDKGFQVNDLFTINNVGVVTSRDSFVINENESVLSKRIKDFFLLEEELFKSNYNVRENKSWKINDVKKKASTFEATDIQKISYRPFDNRFLYYNDFFVERSRKEVMQHFLNGDNIGLTLCKQFKTGDNYVHTFITKKVIESSYVSNKTSEITSTFPLYLYETNEDGLFDENKQKRKPNFDSEILKKIEASLKLKLETDFTPEDLFDYIYAVLHSPKYRETYKEFLKIDFPRIPYPTKQNNFWQLVELGRQIRELHLLESPLLNASKNIRFDGGTDLTVEKPKYVPETQRVYINDSVYFEGVNEIAWNFYIGGYQPAQKWLKDRKGRELSVDDVKHYTQMIIAMGETDRLMKEVDNVI